MLQLKPPEPPLLVMVKLVPTHTLPTFGDFVIVGAVGSHTIVVLTTLLYE